MLSLKGAPEPALRGRRYFEHPNDDVAEVHLADGLPRGVHDGFADCGGPQPQSEHLRQEQRTGIASIWPPLIT